MQKASGQLTANHLQERAHEVHVSMLSHLLEHLRRGKVGELWEQLLACVERDVDAFEAEPSSGAQNIEAPVFN